MVLLVGIGCQAALLLSRVGRGWFGVDALHYLAQRGAVTAPTESLMEPYAGHWQPLLILGYRTLYEFFGLDTYLPYVLPAVVVHLGLCLLLYAVCTRLGANRWAAVLGALTLAWFGAGGEAYLADAPVALTSTVLVAFTCALLVGRRSWGRRSFVVVVLLLVAALMISNAAITAVLFVGLVLLARRGWGPAAILVLVPALVYAVWFLALGRDAERGRFTGGDLLVVPERAISLLVAPFDSVVPGGLGGALLLLVVAGPFLSSRVSPELRAVAWAGMVAALAQSVLCVVANVQLGPDAVLVGRYQYVVLAYLTPALVVTLAWVVEVAAPLLGAPVRSRLAPMVLVAGLLALMVLHGVADQNVAWNITRAEAGRAETLTKGGVASIALGERMLDPDAGGFTVHGDDIQTLGDVGAARWESLAATTEQRLTAESLLFSAADEETFFVQAPATVRSTSFDARLRQKFGCQVVQAQELEPEITLQSFDGAQIAVESDASSVTAVLGRDGETADPVVWQVTPGETTYLATTAQLAEITLTFNAPGSYRICRS
ncbi:hypothetical protein [Nocardioides sp.]|uniref:hypothetical protein n=1 Tax=Nocardioides sp. TaxID=35761 RepID=UPI0035B21BA7